MKEFVELASIGTPLAEIVKNSVEIGIVFPSLLEANLKSAGYAINYQAGTDHGCWVVISSDSSKEFDQNNPNAVAKGFSDSSKDALLQAIYNEVCTEKKLIDLCVKLNASCDEEVLKQFSNVDMGEASPSHRSLVLRMIACAKSPTMLTRDLVVLVDSDKELLKKLVSVTA